MLCFKCTSGDRVLLVGEGNFSFSVDFINFNRETLEDSLSIISSCFEPDDGLHQTAVENVEVLKQKGVGVLFGVDATALKEHPVIGGGKPFSKIIFNFPHVGGKMKIHLNRHLLKDFFASAGQILTTEGAVLVTLCDGQGGTGADRKQRRWDDTWKIVEMAAESGFVLKSICPFSGEKFPKYKSVGYRSLQKGFNINDSLVHIFKLHGPPSIPRFDVSGIEMSLLSQQEVETPFGKLVLSRVYSKKIRRNPLERITSPQYYLLKSIRELCCNDLRIRTSIIEDVLIYGIHSKYENLLSLLNSVDESKKYYRKCITESRSVYSFASLRLNKVGGDFSQQPVSCMYHFVGCYSHEIIVPLMCGLLKKLSDFENLESDEKAHLDTFVQMRFVEVEEFCRKDATLKVCSVLLDNVAKFIFKSDGWKELWAREAYVTETSKGPVLIKSSLYPCSYTFDLTLSTSPDYSEEKFFDIIWDIAGDYISKIELISVYSPNSIKRNYSYRIVYKSHDKPLHRKLVIDIQERIIGKTLESLLNVNVV